MDEGKRYIEGKIHILNEHISAIHAQQKEALFSVKSDTLAVEVENRYQNLKRSFSNPLNYI